MIGGLIAFLVLLLTRMLTDVPGPLSILWVSLICFVLLAALIACLQTKFEIT